MKRHVTLLTTLLVGILAWATVLSPEGALQRAQQQCPRKMRAAVESKGDVTLAYTLCDSTTAEPSVYAFNKPQGGWMLMPADAIAAPVLAFSDNGTIEADKLSPEFLYWMQFYQDEIQQAREREKMRTAPRRTPKEWPAGFGRPDRATIEPLCSTRWNQDSPYNRQCPTVGTARCATGCVATAMAQIMKFHEWPITGTGSKSYTTRTKKFSQSFDFGNTTFDWSNMSDVYTTTTYTTVHDTAVATLMHACGVSVNMDYNTDANGGSGAYSTDLPHAYTTYFGYDKSILFVNRCMYTLREWEDLIYNNLVTYGPVQYSGSSPAGGHSFVCDGIMMNCMFHINWGWGGLSDGYFLLSALDPDSQGIGGSSGGFSEGQGAVINIHRDNGGTSPKGIENQGIYVVTDESSTGFTLNGWFTPISDAGFSGTLYVMAERVTTGSSSGSSIVIPLAPTELCSYNISSLGYGYACPSFNVTGLSSLQNGQYKIRMYYKNSNETQKHVVKTNTQRADYVLYNKATFKSTFTVPLRYNTRVTKITASPAYYCGHNIDVDVTITSDVDGVGVITLYPYFYSLEEGTFNATPVGTVGMTGLTGDLYNGENDFHYSGTLPSASKLAPGTYYLAFAVNAGQKYERQKSGGYMSVDDIVEIGGAAMFELVADPGKPVLDAITNRTHKLVIENSTNVDKTHIGLQYTVKVISGYLNDNLMLAIVPNNSNNIIAQITLPKVECWADQTTTGRCITHWDEGEIGQTYQAALFGPSNGQMTQLTYPQRFTIGQTTTSLNDLDVQGGVKVTPNPVHDVATVTSKQPIEEVEAYSIEGIAIPINADINGTRTTLDMASFSPGVYVLRLRLEDGSVTTTRLVKK